MARKPIAQPKQFVMIEGIDNPVEVLDVALASVVTPEVWKAAIPTKSRRPVTGYMYRCRMARVQPKWFYEHEINYVFTYKPAILEPARHAELADALGGYEMLRDFLATLPHGKRKGKHVRRGGYPVMELIKLVEYCALVAEGDSQERTDAEAEIISIMQ